MLKLKSNENIIKIISKEISKAVSWTVDFLNEANISYRDVKVSVEKTKNPQFGDFTTNVALSIGLKKERVLVFADKIAQRLKKNTRMFKDVNVVQPGFINIRLSHYLVSDVIKDILKQKDNYGFQKPNGKTYQIEFVSANPTGLLHIGHARNAAIGDTLANILEANGYKTIREYYINDAGNQIEKLALSVLIRYFQIFGKSFNLPEDSYHGEEILEVANALKKEYGEKFLNLTFNDQSILAFNDEELKKKEEIKDFSKKYLLVIIDDHLKQFGVNMDIWFPESILYKENLIDVALNKIKAHTFEKENALWLKTSELGDDKDRVLIKSDKTYTYFLPDIAYHILKMSRGYDKSINIWGSDHKSYADRMKIAMKLAGFNPDDLVILIMQMVRLIKNGEEFKMSKRTGNSLTLKDLLIAIGKDAARWYLVSQPTSTHLEIDVDKVLSQNNNNPLYYVQYAYARINQILAKAEYKVPESFKLLNDPLEHELVTLMSIYENTLNKISENFEVNILTLYLTNLAKAFHAFYAQFKVIDNDNVKISAQRYYLVKCVQQIIGSGLRLLGIKPMEKM